MKIELLSIKPFSPADALIRVFNPDCFEAIMSRNGTRYFPKCFYSHDFEKKEKKMETMAGAKEAILNVENDKMTYFNVEISKPYLKERIYELEVTKIDVRAGLEEGPHIVIKE